MKKKQLEYYSNVRVRRILAMRAKISRFIGTNRSHMEECAMMETDLSEMQMNSTYRDKLLDGIAEDMRKKFGSFQEPPDSKDWYQFCWDQTDSTKTGHIKAELFLTMKEVRATKSSFSLEYCKYWMCTLEYPIIHPPSPKPYSLRPSEGSNDETTNTILPLASVSDASVLPPFSGVNTINTA
jgi:hypothetical protein